MVKGILKGAADALVYLIANVLILFIATFAFIKIYKLEFGVALSLIFGGFLVGVWVGTYHNPDWMHGVGLIFIIIGLIFLFFLSDKYHEK